MRTHKTYLDGKLVDEIPFTLKEEIQEDARVEMINFAKKFVTGAKVDNITDWRARFDPDKAVQEVLVDIGEDPTKVSPQIKNILKFLLKMYIMAVLYAHGTIPGETL